MTTGSKTKELWKNPLYREKMRLAHLNKNVKHGMAKGKSHPFYRKWMNLRARCLNEKNPGYRNYGGRGIQVEWDSFVEFYRDMFPSYVQHVQTHGDSETTIERKDFKGNYSKENCTWATHKEQSNNCRTNVKNSTCPLCPIINRMLAEKYTHRQIAKFIKRDVAMVCYHHKGHHPIRP